MDKERGQESEAVDTFYPSPEKMKYLLDLHYANKEILAYLEKFDASPELLFSWPSERKGTLTDVGILRHLVAGNIEIHPFEHNQLQTNGYDVRLGEWFFMYGGVNEDSYPSLDGRKIYNPTDLLNVRDAWGEPYKAMEADRLRKRLEVYPRNFLDSKPVVDINIMNNIRPEDKLILVPGGTMLLCHTEEFIGGKNVITTRISGKSTVGRSLLEVCSDANLGDVGFVNRWALEVVNKNHEGIIIIPAGDSIATIQFEGVEVPIGAYNGRYKAGSNLAQTMDAWTPSQMLPTWKRSQT